jgi:hypothetical protein
VLKEKNFSFAEVDKIFSASKGQGKNLCCAQEELMAELFYPALFSVPGHLQQN